MRWLRKFDNVVVINNYVVLKEAGYNGGSVKVEC
jgi:hypothetical protein